MKRAFLSLVALVAILSSCNPDQPDQKVPEFEWDSNLAIPEYHAIITDGCDTTNTAISTMDMPYVDPRGGAVNSFWADLGITILDKASDLVLYSLKAEASAKLRDFFFGSDQTSVRLDQIMEELTVIKEQMNTLLNKAEETLQKIDEVQYNQMHDGYVDFQVKISTMTALNNEFSDKFREDMTNEEIAEVMKAWGDRVINGSNAPYVLTSLATQLSNFSYLYNGKMRNLFAVYDMIVYHNTPWENQGYDIRDMFRAATAAEIARTIYMTALYFTVTDSPSSLNNVQQCAQWFSDFFSTSGNPVTRRTDRAVCQLKGAQFILQADALYEHKSWTGSCWMNGDQTTFADGVLSSSPDVSKTKESQFTDDEIKTVVGYYKNLGKGMEYTILNCLEEGGLNVPDQYKTPYTLDDQYHMIVRSYHKVYLMSQQTFSETYITQYYDAFVWLQHFYCTGFPLGALLMDGALGTGAEPNYSWSMKRYDDDTIEVGGDTYEKMVGFGNFLFFKKWALRGDDLTFPFPGEYFLGMKPGSLTRYSSFDDIN